MAILDDITEQEVAKNKAIRGYIIRALARGNQNALLVRQLTNALVADGMIFSPDISKYLDYLADGGYIEFSGAARPEAHRHGQHLRRALRVAEGGGL